MNHLGNLEEMVLLVVAVMHNEAYGVSITKEYNEQTGQSISLSAVHTVLRRLENKGFIESEMGSATSERGGRRKRLYKVTRFGLKTLEEIQQSRVNLWKRIPGISFN